MNMPAMDLLDREFETNISLPQPVTNLDEAIEMFIGDFMARYDYDGRCFCGHCHPWAERELRDFDWSWIATHIDPHHNTRTMVNGERVWVPVKYSGTLPKRLARWALVHNVRIPKEALGDLGSALRLKGFFNRESQFEKHHLTVSFTNSFDWSPGDYGDSGSCYWGCHYEAKEWLRDYGGMAILFHAADVGVARCWLAPVNKFYGAAWVIFNAYWRTDIVKAPGNYPLLAMADVLSGILHMPYRKVSLTNWGDAGGVIYINSTTCFAFPPPNFEYIDLEMGYSRCHNCGGKYEATSLHRVHRPKLEYDRLVWVCNWCSSRTMYEGYLT